MDEFKILESIEVENLKVNLIFLLDEKFFGLEIEDEGDCQTYDTEQAARRDFLSLKNGEQTIDEVFGYS